jgi:hypothetical protein
MTSSPTPDPSDFGPRAAAYDDLRPLDHGALELIETVVREAELALRRIRRRFASTFDLIPDDEYLAGLARAEKELPERVEYRSGWLIAIADVELA